MTNIYRKVPLGGLLRPGDHVISHNGQGWVFGNVEDIDLEKGEATVTATSRPMLSIEEAGKQADKEATHAVRNARRAGIDLGKSILSSQDVEIEELNDGAWPSTDRTERRKLDDLDPLAQAIQNRLYPDAPWQSGDVWLTTEFITGGYSEYTMEQEYGLVIECGEYRVSIGHGSHDVPLDDLLGWLDGETHSAITTTKETA